MNRTNLSFNTRKSLANHLGEEAGRELAEMVQHLLARVESLEQRKVDVTPVVPQGATLVDAAAMGVVELG